MKIAICYVFPVHLPRYNETAKRFASTYLDFPPGETEHELHVYTNGGSITTKQRELFGPLSPVFHPNGNIGKDIGAYQRAASEISCDLLICLGSPVYFHRAGWLDWIVRVYEANGPALYGCWGFYEPKHHLRTTAFWFPPVIMQSYPSFVNDGYRYEFEHGQNSIVNWSKRLGFENYMVTWKGAFPESQWHHIPRADCLMLDQHVDRVNLQ